MRGWVGQSPPPPIEGTATGLRTLPSVAPYHQGLDVSLADDIIVAVDITDTDDNPATEALPMPDRRVD
ncbi:MAG: hypothetical protein PVI57_16910 [Gemmatimonadota bacterium]|jgi:hypothetical protein